MKTRKRFNCCYLKGFLYEKHISQEEYAKILGITRQSVYNKLRGKSSFNAYEVETTRKFFRLTQKQVEQLFFYE